MFFQVFGFLHYIACIFRNFVYAIKLLNSMNMKTKLTYNKLCLPLLQSAGANKQNLYIIMLEISRLT